MGMPVDPTVAALARQQLNQAEDSDELARKQAEARAAAEAQAEADAVVSSRVRATKAEDEDSAFTSRKRTMRRIAAGWEPLATPSMPTDSLE